MNLSYDDVERPEPLFHGDTLRVQLTVTDTREISDWERSIVTMHIEVPKSTIRTNRLFIRSIEQSSR